MAGFPDQVIKGKNQYPGGKRDHGQVFKGKFAKQRFGIKTGKLTDHPVRIGRDPDRNRQVMA